MSCTGYPGSYSTSNSTQALIEIVTSTRCALLLYRTTILTSSFGHSSHVRANSNTGSSSGRAGALSCTVPALAVVVRPANVRLDLLRNRVTVEKAVVGKTHGDEVDASTSEQTLARGVLSRHRRCSRSRTARAARS
jgi:hypothetical protein